MPHVAIALGSNLGDRRAHLEWAIERLRGVLDQVRVSAFLDTEPVDVPDPQPRYLNAVVVGESRESPEALLAALRRLEDERGRTRTSFRGARTLDLDLIFHGDSVISTPDLEIPHPRFRTRRFVLEPLASLAPEWMDPVTGRTVAQLLRERPTERPTSGVG
jgi:2-amino-4-hydroxy-6-hydroxymethyldihydropteridine diphosphokinase